MASIPIPEAEEAARQAEADEVEAMGCGCVEYHLADCPTRVGYDDYNPEHDTDAYYEAKYGDYYSD